MGEGGGVRSVIELLTGAARVQQTQAVGHWADRTFVFVDGLQDLEIIPPHVRNTARPITRVKLRLAAVQGISTIACSLRK